MIDVTPDIISLFKSNNITLIDEYAQDSINIYPLVTYSLTTNIDNIMGDNVGYSNISYTINIWSYSRKECVDLAQKIDGIMKAIKFERSGGDEQYFNGLHRQIMAYSRTMREIY